MDWCDPAHCYSLKFNIVAVAAAAAVVVAAAAAVVVAAAAAVAVAAVKQRAQAQQVIEKGVQQKMTPKLGECMNGHQRGCGRLCRKQACGG